MMAEMLIRKMKHFAEDFMPVGWSLVKWVGRPRQGDIVEVREDGYWRIEALKQGKRHWRRDMFCLIRLPGEDEKSLSYLHSSYSNDAILEDGTPKKATVMHKNRYRIVLWENVPWIKNKVKIDGIEYDEWYKDFALGISSIALLNKAG